MMRGPMCGRVLLWFISSTFWLCYWVWAYLTPVWIFSLPLWLALNIGALGSYHTRLSWKQWDFELPVHVKENLKFLKFQNSGYCGPNMSYLIFIIDTNGQSKVSLPQHSNIKQHTAYSWSFEINEINHTVFDPW